MGKRLFEYNLLHPSCNVEYLNLQYNITDYILANSEDFDEIYLKLRGFNDIEKQFRKIILNRIYPFNH